MHGKHSKISAKNVRISGEIFGGRAMFYCLKDSNISPDTYVRVVSINNTIRTHEKSLCLFARRTRRTRSDQHRLFYCLVFRDFRDVLPFLA